MTGVKVIAECVEDDGILASLMLLKVGFAQGFGIQASPNRSTNCSNPDRTRGIKVAQFAAMRY